jgi:DNA-binding transcriptional MerR regulator
MCDVNQELLTVDELARRAGTVSSTVRLYQSRGLLPPPARTGRMAFYGPGHLARMRLIGQLQQRGFSLAAIKELVDGWEAGRDLADVLGLEQRAATWAGEEPMHLGLSELRRRLPRGILSPAVLRRAIKLGLLQREGRGFRVASPKFLEAGAELVKLGIPIDAVLDEYERLGQTTGEIAARFTELFERHLWQPFAEAGMPPERIRELTATLARLGPLAESVVALTLRHALQQQAAAFIAKLAGESIHPHDRPR